MKVYFDNNIIASIENGDYTLQNVKSALPNEEEIFLYSFARLF